jgi:hypothetical protein
MIAATMAAATRPDTFLSSEQLQRKIPAMRNPANFDLATTQFSCPRPATLSPAGSPLGDGGLYCWSERRVDAWLADMREKAEQIRRFV